MRFAYADPPYLDQCARYGHDHREPYGCWDQIRAHALLIDELKGEFPDGWALSASSPSLRYLLPYVPERARICAWVKPFAAFKANVRNAYTWEPVIVCGGRLSSRDGAPVTRDHLRARTANALECVNCSRPIVWDGDRWMHQLESGFYLDCLGLVATSPLDEPDALAESITLRRGLTGTKPAAFHAWVLKLLGYVPGDEVSDLFPGLGGLEVVMREVVPGA